MPSKCLPHVISVPFWILFLGSGLLAADGEKTIYEQAAVQVQGGHPEVALALLQPWVDAHPDDVKALTLLGMAFARDGKGGNANEYFGRALRLRPSYPPALKGLATSELDLKQYAAAREHFEQLLTVSPGDFVAHAGLAQIAFASQDFSQAARHFQESESLARKVPRLLLEYARSEIALKEDGKARTLLNEMPDGADAEAHFDAGILLASMKAFDAAVRQFELALPGYPDHYRAGFNLVLACVKSGDYKRAVAEGEKLIARGERNAELYNLLAEGYEKAGNTKSAYDSLRTATQIEPADEANYVDLVSLCIDHKNYDLALEIAAIRLGKLPSSERIHLQLGVVFAMKEQFEEAQKEFERAVALAPGKSLPHVALALALALMQMNRPDEAVQKLRDRIRRSPDDYLALWYLGEALNRSGTTPGSRENREAIAALERSVRLNGSIAQSHELLGKFLSREGQLAEAAKHLESAMHLEPANESAMYQLAQVYSKQGNAARAQPLFAKVKEIKAEQRENFTKGRLQQILRADSAAR